MATVTTVLLNARDILQDLDSAAYRYTDAQLVRYLNEAVREIYRLRPDAMLGSYNDDLPTYVEGDIEAATAVAVPDFLSSVLTNYVVGRAEMRDDEFAVDGRAAILTNRAVAQLRTSEA